MKIGFTGTRDGLTPEQRSQLAAWLRWSGVSEFRHGCCVGADSQAAMMAYSIQPRPWIVGHPSDLPEWYTDQAAVLLSRCVRSPKPPLARNRDIVDACDVLLACPKTVAEEQRSGTWATIRYARKRGKRVVIFWPHGTVSDSQQPASESAREPAAAEPPVCCHRTGELRVIDPPDAAADATDAADPADPPADPHAPDLGGEAG